MKNFTWSFSSLKDYINCPRQYHEIKVLKNYTKRQTTEMLYGTTVHKICEDYVGKGLPLAKNYQQFQPVLDTLLEIEGDKYPEHKMALDIHLNPCNYGTGYWVRGIVDLLIVDGDMAYIIDYKTGSSRYPDSKQLKLMALMTFAHFPQVQRIKAGLLFIVHNAFVNEEYSKEQIEQLWETFQPDLMRLEASLKNGVWNPNRTPLCAFCPVTKCEYYKEKR